MIEGGSEAFVVTSDRHYMLAEAFPPPINTQLSHIKPFSDEMPRISPAFVLHGHVMRTFLIQWTIEAETLADKKLCV